MRWVAIPGQLAHAVQILKGVSKGAEAALSEERMQAEFDACGDGERVGAIVLCCDGVSVAILFNRAYLHRLSENWAMRSVRSPMP